MSVWLAFVAGVVSILSPCLLPIVPAFAGIVAGGGLADSRVPEREPGALAVLRYPVLFFVGFAGLFVLVGATATPLSWWIRGTLATIQALGGLAILLVAGGVLFAARWPVAGSDPARYFWRIAAVSIGAGVSAAWTPCIGPVLATILLQAGSPGSMAAGMILLLIYTAGLGIPFLLLGAGAVWLARRATEARRADMAVRGLIATGLIVVGLLLVTGRFAWMSATLSRYGPLISLPV